MNCPYCGTRNRARAQFCRRCRALLPRPAEPSRWSIIADARGPAALVLLVIAVVAAFLLGRQAVTLIGAPAAVATAPSTPPGSSQQQAPPVTPSPAPTATPRPAPTSTPPTTTPVAGPTSLPPTGTPVAGPISLPPTTTPVAGPAPLLPASPTRSPVRRHARQALAQIHRAPSPSPTARPSPSAPPTAEPTPRPRHTPAAGGSKDDLPTPHRATSRPRGAADVAAEARVSAAVIASNVAWMRALETASPLGLDRIKTGSNLQSILREVTLLRELDEYWRIDVQQVRVIWARLLGPTDARALMRKIGESRRLYRRGRATPLEVDGSSYTNLYDLTLVDGHWLVARVAAVDDATAARLAASPPTGYQASQP